MFAPDIKKNISQTMLIIISNCYFTTLHQITTVEEQTSEVFATS